MTGLFSINARSRYVAWCSPVPYWYPTLLMHRSGGSAMLYRVHAHWSLTKRYPPRGSRRSPVCLGAVCLGLVVLLGALVLPHGGMAEARPVAWIQTSGLRSQNQPAESVSTSLDTLKLEWQALHLRNWARALTSEDGLHPDCGPQDFDPFARHHNVNLRCGLNMAVVGSTFSTCTRHRDK